MEDRLVAVGEDDTVELQAARDPADLGCAGLVRDVVLGVEHRRDLGHRGTCRLHLPVELRQLLQRLEDELQHPDRRNEGADLERAAVDQPGAGEEHHDDRDDTEELDRGEEERRQLLGVDVRDPVRLVEVAELALESAFAPERLDDGHARDGLRQLRGDGSDPRAHVRERHVRGGLEPPRHDDPRRQDDERHHTQAPVEQEQPTDGGHERHRVDDERRQALVQDIREGVDVTRQAGDDPAGLLLGEVPQRQRRQVLEEVAAKVEHDLLPDAGQHQPCRRAEEPRRQTDGDVEHDIQRQPGRVRRLDAVVDRIADDHPAEHRSCREDRGEDHDEADPPAAAHGVAPEPGETGAVPRRQWPRPRRAQ